MYGCTESKEIAWECPQHAGYHINADWILLESVGAGDVSELVTTLLEKREIAAGDLARLRRLIEDKERELRGEKNTGEKPDA